VHNALRQFGQVLGVAVLGVIVYARVPTGGGQRLDHARSLLFVDGLHGSIWVSGIALLAAAALVALLAPARTDAGGFTGS
jgi:hypothetical protein